MLLSFVTSNAFIITVVCVLFFFLLGGITLYRMHKEENVKVEENEITDEIKEDESN